MALGTPPANAGEAAAAGSLGPRRRRRLLLLLAFGAVLIALLWGLVLLCQVFRAERTEALAALAEQQRALELFALRSVQEELAARLRAAEPRIRRALEDPLAPAAGLLCFVSSLQRLPHRFTSLPGAATPAADLYKALLAGEVSPPADDPDSPWAARLAALADLRHALAAGDDTGVAAAFRTVLAERLRFRIDVALDLPFMLSALELLQRESRPERDLLRALLMDGLEFQPEGRLEALARQLLERRERFTAADFRFLAGRLVEIGDTAEVPTEAFRRRAAEDSGPSFSLPPNLPPRAFVAGGRYYVEAVASGSGHHGVAVDLPALLEATGAAMRGRALIGPADHAVTNLPEVDVASVDDLIVELSLANRPEQLRRIDERFRIKTGLALFCGLLAAGLAVFAVAFVRRRQRVLELQREFVATVSHELRTPLAAVRLLAETLERKCGGLPRAKDYPARIVRVVDGLGFLVENILSFHRLDRHRVVVRREPLELGELIEPLPAALRPGETREIDVGSAGAEHGPLHGDPELVRLLLLNLGRNSCLYNENVRVEIRLELLAAAGGRRLRYRDNGWGFDRATERSAFAEFVRGRPAAAERARPGTGLGLAICRRIMQLHSGRIDLVETGPSGTTFEMFFPAMA